MRKSLLIFFLLSIVIDCFAQKNDEHNLRFDDLATRWDEGIPLGNGMLGALMWRKDGKIRLSLDRADIWDRRKAFDITKLSFKWVASQTLKKDYRPVQDLTDRPYTRFPYPTKLPAAALSFSDSLLGKVVSNVLDIHTATATVKFESGAIFNSYVHATLPMGCFEFTNVPKSAIKRLIPSLDMHDYQGLNLTKNDNSHAAHNLKSLGYPRGKLSTGVLNTRYRQPTHGGNFFEVLVEWRWTSNRLVGFWTITNNAPASLHKTEIAGNRESHLRWWAAYWEKSRLDIPNKSIERQYYLDMYKFGSVSRSGAPAITLQAIWTADNGSLPPWKGDFHNDLNTQLSYWPAYTSNHLNEAASYTEWLWRIRAENKNYTKAYFKVPGINVPGISDIDGNPMGGWSQYSLSPTVSAWSAQHFYLEWKHSMNSKFLRTRAYPYIREAAIYLENVTQMKRGKRYLPLSSSPEYNDNKIEAWFLDWTNYDLSLAKFLFSAAAETAGAVDRKAEQQHWSDIAAQLPKLDYNNNGLTIAPGQDMGSSHRHFSQYMAIYPLALMDINHQIDKEIIDNSIQYIEKLGTRAWVGYSFTWMACIYARAQKADKALEQLQIFTSNFCSPNSFHLNGDQKGGEYSDFNYRPFTLEGNFAFAQAVHELFVQSKTGYTELFCAIPSDWKNLSFSNLRTQGAALISGKMNNGKVTYIRISCEKSGKQVFKFPFGVTVVSAKGIVVKNVNNGLVTLTANAGGVIELRPSK